MDFNELKEKAIEVGDSDSSMNGAFCSKDEQLIFVTHGKMFVVPWTKSALQILENEGFVRAKIKLDFYLVPYEKKYYWEKLIDLLSKEKPA